MATGSEFSTACKTAARQMRRLPAELRRTLANEVKTDVAEPLAADIRGAWSGPYARVLAAGTKARVQTDPRVVVGGSRKAVSGGASVRQLVYGAEWGGGRRVKAIPKTPKRRGHRRRTTQQFPRAGQHAVYGTIHRTLDKTFERWVDVVVRVIDKGMSHG